MISDRGRAHGALSIPQFFGLQVLQKESKGCGNHVCMKFGVWIFLRGLGMLFDVGLGVWRCNFLGEGSF